MDKETTSCGVGSAILKTKISFVNNNDMSDDEIKDFTEGLTSPFNFGFSLNGTIYNPKKTAEETERKYKEEMKEAKRKLNEAKNKKEKDKRQKKKDRYDRMMKIIKRA